MSKKLYRLHGDNFDMTVEVDHAVLTEDKLHEINNFWSAADHRLKEHDGSVLDAILEMLFSKVQFMVAEAGGLLSLNSALFKFSWRDRRGAYKDGEEGWPDMDGSYGIRIVEIGELTFDESPLIEEVQP